MDSIDELLAFEYDWWDDPAFDSTGSNEYSSPRKPFPRRSNTNDSYGDPPSYAERRKATVTDLEDGEESESEVPERFQEFFNPDYKPPVADAVNGASEEKVE
ncbi:hypothetical protein SLS54_005290 [Diplodia seriata]